MQLKEAAKSEDLVKRDYPDLYEEMCTQDMYHVAEYCDWFIRGLNLSELSPYEDVAMLSPESWTEEL
jgi:hypothetical protein